jgi:hypothetical protein
VQLCHGSDKDEALCREYFIGTTLLDAIEDFDPNAMLISVTSGINDLVMEANRELEAAYDQACQEVNDLNTALQMSALPVPGFCTSEQLPRDLVSLVNSLVREVLCLPFTEAGRVDAECGVDKDSRYTRLADFRTGFEKLHCKDVPDMPSAIEDAVQAAVDSFRAPSGPAIACALDDRFIGNTLFEDIANKAEVAGAIFDR